MSLPQVTKEHLDHWALHPLDWLAIFLPKVRLWAKQQEIMEAVAHHDAVSVRSGHGVGKSFVVACIVLWYLFSHPFSKIVSTAPTLEQSKTILWDEIRTLHKELSKKMEYCGELYEAPPGLKIEPGWWAVARNPKDSHSFLGAHKEHLLVIFDEASGISRAIFDAASGLTTGQKNKQLIIGNPLEPGSYFHETHTGDVPGFHRIHISVYDSPNIRWSAKKNCYEDNVDAEGNLPYPSLTSLEWVSKRIKEWGIGSSQYQSKILGEFPTISTDSLIDSRHLSAAVQKGLYLRETLKKIQEGNLIMTPEEVKKMVGR